MKRKDLNFKHTLHPSEDFIRRCVMPPSYDKDTEYAKKVYKLIRKSENTDDFVNRFIDDKEFAHLNSQAYAEMLKEYFPKKVWYFVRGSLGDNVRKTLSDAGGLKIGNDNFSIIIPNGRGDGITRYSVLSQTENYASNIMRFFTSVSGKINIFSSDCGDEICETITGRFGIYFYEGIIVFERWETLNRQAGKSYRTVNSCPSGASYRAKSEENMKTFKTCKELEAYAETLPDGELYVVRPIVTRVDDWGYCSIGYLLYCMNNYMDESNGDYFVFPTLSEAEDYLRTLRSDVDVAENYHETVIRSYTIEKMLIEDEYADSEFINVYAPFLEDYYIISEKKFHKEYPLADTRNYKIENGLLYML